MQRPQLFRSREQVSCRGSLVHFHISIAEVNGNAGLTLLDLHASQAYSERAVFSSPWLRVMSMSSGIEGKESRALGESEVTEVSG